MIMLVVIMIIVMVAMIVEHNQYNIDVLDNYGTVGYQPSLLHYLEFVWMFLYQFWCKFYRVNVVAPGPQMWCHAAAAAAFASLDIGTLPGATLGKDPNLV